MKKMILLLLSMNVLQLFSEENTTQAPLHILIEFVGKKMILFYKQESDFSYILPAYKLLKATTTFLDSADEYGDDTKNYLFEDRKERFLETLKAHDAYLGSLQDFELKYDESPTVFSNDDIKYLEIPYSDYTDMRDKEYNQLSKFGKYWYNVQNNAGNVCVVAVMTVGIMVAILSKK